MSSDGPKAEFAWEVVPAERRRSRWDDAKPTGHVSFEVAGETRFVDVPQAVARLLVKKRRTGEVDPRTPSELEDVLASATSQAARICVVQILSRRDYARGELERKLAREGFDEATVRATMAWAQEARLVDDARYAEVFVRSKVSAGWGMSRISRELDARGIDVGDLEGWPYEYIDPDDELVRAVEVASRKRVREPNAYAKLVRFLMGRGFSCSVARDAAGKVLS